MIKFQLQVPEHALADSAGLVPLILKSAARALYENEQLGADEAAALAGVTLEQFLFLAGERGVTAPEVTHKLEGSRYLIRVLWALFEGERQSLTPMTAADIAKFVSQNSSLNIEQTNTARFFRECRVSGKFEHYWQVCEQGSRRRYQLSDAGRDALLRYIS